MTKNPFAAAALALPILAAGSAWAGPTDGSRQVVSPPIWLQQESQEPKPYALTGNANPPVQKGSWTREVERLGNKVEIERYRR